MTANIIQFPKLYDGVKQDKHCSFCGLHKEDVGALVRGEKAFICNSCIDICDKLLKENEDVGPTVA